jgi:hypothetical protein
VRVFGPFYPPALQTLVDHAERLADLLAVRELTLPVEEWAQAWTMGRADEIVRFTEHVVGLWERLRLGDGAAASMLEGYLAIVHEGLAIYFARKPPSCCKGGLAYRVARDQHAASP